MLSSFSHWLTQWILNQTTHLSLVVFRQVIFAPLAWSSGVTTLFHITRGVVMAGLAAVAGWGFLSTLWPALWPGGVAPSPLRMLQRVLTAAILTWLVVPAVQWILEVNNAIVREILASAQGFAPTITTGQALLSPLLSGLIVIVSALLLVYLGIFYALRVVEIFVLTALSPVMLAWWGVTGDANGLGRWGREVLIAIFIQSIHAAVFWLYLHLVYSTEISQFEAVGVLFYMTRVPEQVRRLLGSPGVGSVLMPWR